jgi:hypothetical protein
MEGLQGGDAVSAEVTDVVTCSHPWLREMDEVAAKIIELEELIRWLALPYNGAEPIFAHSNWDGTPIDSGARLTRTWRRVVGPGTVGLGGTWVRCPHCGVYSVHSEPVNAIGGNYDGDMPGT